MLNQDLFHTFSLKKQKLGEDILDDEDDSNVPGTRDTPSFISDEDFKSGVRNSHLLPLFDIKGTVINKSFCCTPHTQDIIQEVHGEHTTLSSCSKCMDFLKKCVTGSKSDTDQYSGTKQE